VKFWERFDIAMTGAADWPNLATMFFRQAARLGETPFLWHKRDGAWQPESWASVARRTAAFTRALTALGVAPGDRIALVSENRPEWPIADIAIMSAGGITVPAYTTNAVRDYLHVFRDSGATGVIVSNAALAERVLPAAVEAQEMRFIITIDETALDPHAGLDIHRWDALLGDQDASPDGVAARAEETLDRATTACLIYTSGTGGVPKGVMLSHGAILANCHGAEMMLGEANATDAVFLSFLPLSHSYEHTVGQFWPISMGAQLYYAEGMDRLAANMLEARPTLMTAVPRLYESIHDRIQRGVRQAGGKTEMLFNKTLELGRRRYETGRLGPVDSIIDAVLDRLVRRKVQARFGGRLRALVSGGAPLNYEIGLFFTALGVPILQGYGQTEAAPVVSCNPPGRIKIETVGPPLDGVEVEIAGDGEILVRGELVMQGYWGDADATRETIRDGWLHTGDIGAFDQDGYLSITDRKKDIIVNSGGDNLSPQRVEGFLSLQREIAQAMVHGDRRPHLVALIVPEPEFARDWAGENGKAADLAALSEDADFRAAISAAIDRVNAGLSVIEKVRRFTLTDEPFTIDNGMMTPTMKIRRHAILEKYGDRLTALYGG